MAKQSPHKTWKSRQVCKPHKNRVFGQSMRKPRADRRALASGGGSATTNSAPNLTPAVSGAQGRAGAIPAPAWRSGNISITQGLVGEGHSGRR